MVYGLYWLVDGGWFRIDGSGFCVGGRGFKLRSPQRALPTETKVESGTSQSKSIRSVNLGQSGFLMR
jgi:hypothetical protein